MRLANFRLFKDINHLITNQFSILIRGSLPYSGRFFYAAGIGASIPAHKFIVFSSSRPHAFR